MSSQKLYGRKVWQEYLALDYWACSNSFRPLGVSMTAHENKGFSDGDLNKLKIHLNASPDSMKDSACDELCHENIRALLDRLDAAEDALSSAAQGPVFIHNKDMERWRKAAGK